MNRVVFFIDGFNLYHALEDNPRFAKYKWLDMSRLAKCFVQTNQQIAKIFYFTAYASWNPQKLARHRVFVRALRWAGVDVVLGEFKYKQRFSTNCKTLYETFEEKETDVNIALKLFKAAVMDEYDTAILVSGDSDLVPAVKEVKATFPTKKIGVIVPIGHNAEDMKKNCDFRFKMKEKHLASSQFPNTINLPGGGHLIRPASWL
jgi:uncharacterized LabA/DUF88 family protein